MLIGGNAVDAVAARAERQVQLLALPHVAPGGGPARFGGRRRPQRHGGEVAPRALVALQRGAREPLACHVPVLRRALAVVKHECDRVLALGIAGLRAPEHSLVSRAEARAGRIQRRPPRRAGPEQGQRAGPQREAGQGPEPPRAAKPRTPACLQRAQVVSENSRPRAQAARARALALPSKGASAVSAQGSRGSAWVENLGMRLLSGIVGFSVDISKRCAVARARARHGFCG